MKAKSKRWLAIGVSLVMVLAISALFVAGAAADPIDPPKLLDSVNIGDTTSENGCDLLGWTNIWSGCGWCGPDKNMRLIWGGEGGTTCDLANNWASVTLDAGARIADSLKVQHLDGAADDGFNVYVNDDLVGTYVDYYPSNTWTATEFDISSGRYKGELTIKFEATAPAWGGCGTYGQVAFNEIELYAELVPVDKVFLTPKKLNVGRKAEHSFKVHVYPSQPIDVSVGDEAQVYVDDVEYPAIVSSTDEDGAATDIAIKVYVGDGLEDINPTVAIYTVNGINIAYADGSDIDDLVLDTFTSGKKK